VGQAHGCVASAFSFINTESRLKANDPTAVNPGSQVVISCDGRVVADVS
jgi:hypothetical protein